MFNQVGNSCSSADRQGVKKSDMSDIFEGFNSNRGHRQQSTHSF